MSPLARTAVIILAGGSGARFGSKKQFTQIGRKPMFWWTLEAISDLAEVEQIILVLPEDDLADANELVGGHTVTNVVVGGRERTDSVRAGLAVVSDEIEIVLVHDAARPLASSKLFSSVIESTVSTGAAIPCIDVADTIKEVDGCSVTNTPDRSRLRAAQTPQGFRREILQSAYDHALSAGVIGTDDSRLVELMGQNVTVIPGEEDNIKVTSQRDARLVELIIDSRKDPI